MRHSAALIIWCLLAIIAITPVMIASTSPYIKGRDVVYIVGAMGGIVGLSLLLFQPLLAAGFLPMLRNSHAKIWHKIIGFALVLSVITHIVGLYLTSPMDMTDALLLASPTAFSVYGVIALWSLIATTILVALRSRLNWSYTTWKLVHNFLVVLVVMSSVVHALMIEGLMGRISKTLVCTVVLLVIVTITVYLRVFSGKRR